MIPGATFGSSIVNTAFPALDDTVVDSVDASAFGTPSIVRKSALPALRSYTIMGRTQ